MLAPAADLFQVLDKNVSWSCEAAEFNQRRLKGEEIPVEEHVPWRLVLEGLTVLFEYDVM